MRENKKYYDQSLYDVYLYTQNRLVKGFKGQGNNFFFSTSLHVSDILGRYTTCLE